MKLYKLREWICRDVSGAYSHQELLKRLRKHIRIIKNRMEPKEERG